jgi:hypothetical protein
MKHIVKLTMEDNIYHKIMFMLKSLQSKGLKIEELKEDSSKQTTKSKIKELFSTHNTELFKSIDDPMQWQKNQRNEW